MLRIEITEPTAADAKMMMALAHAILGTGEVSITHRVGELSVTTTGPADGRPRIDPIADLANESARSQSVFGDGYQLKGQEPHIAKDDIPSTGLAAASEVFGKSPLPNGAVAVPSPPPSSGAAVPSVTPPTPQPIVPVPPPVVPVAPPPGAPTPAPGTELDADGLPWDHRIHAESKAINKGDGKWKAKRNVAAELVAAVQAEHRAILGVAAPNPFAGLKTAGELGIGSPAPSPVPAVPPVPSPLPVPPAPVAASITPPVPSGAQPGISFAELIPKVTAALAAQTIDQDKVLTVLSAHGVATLPGLMAHPHLVGSVALALGLA